MHVFDELQAPDAGAVVALVRATPFATMVSIDADDAGPLPVATHLPVIPAPGTDLSNGLEGAVLWTHMATANPQWRTLVADDRVLVIFNGPGSYVSASTYQGTPAAPTWNYAAVHALGRARVLTDPDAALNVILATIEALERDRAQPFDVTASLDYYRQILPEVTVLSITVESAQAVFKLSQDKPDDLYARVRDDLADTASDVAALMTATNAHRRHRPDHHTGSCPEHAMPSVPAVHGMGNTAGTSATPTRTGIATGTDNAGMSSR